MVRSTCRGFVCVLVLSAAFGCGSEPGEAAPEGRDAVVDVGPPPAAPPDREPATDGGAAAPAASDARFASSVRSFEPGPCAGFGRASFPAVVLGAPRGGGETQGSLDVLSLGEGGSIVLDLGEGGVVDGEGADLIVFENAFYVAGDRTRPVVDLGEVSVSDDGSTWVSWPCTATAFPYGACAGWHPVLSAPGNGIDPTDPARAGGDAFDLADVGVARARFVRVVDMRTHACTEGVGPGTVGFDLDAVAVVHRGAR